MSTTYTANYHLGKQEDASDNFDMSVITENMDTIDSVLGNKQARLTAAQLAAVNSGIDSTKVAQITTNKNNILTLINYFDFFPIFDKTNAGADNVVNQALNLQAGKYRFTATVVGSGSSQLKFSVGENGEIVDTKTWKNGNGTTTQISEVYNLTSNSTWVTLYANSGVTYTNMSLKIDLS